MVVGRVPFRERLYEGAAMGAGIGDPKGRPAGERLESDVEHNACNRVSDRPTVS
jgi:hypothetical protein